MGAFGSMRDLICTIPNMLYVGLVGIVTYSYDIGGDEEQQHLKVCPQSH